MCIYICIYLYIYIYITGSCVCIYIHIYYIYRTYSRDEDLGNGHVFWGTFVGKRAFSWVTLPTHAIFNHF